MSPARHICQARQHIYPLDSGHPKLADVRKSMVCLIIGDSLAGLVGVTPGQDPSGCGLNNKSHSDLGTYLNHADPFMDTLDTP
jgi:hypothetical protein